MARGSKDSWGWSVFQFVCLAIALTASDIVARTHYWTGMALFVIAFGTFVATFYGRRTDVGRGEVVLFSGIGALAFAILIPFLWHDPVVILIIPGCVFFLAIFFVLVRSKPRQKPVRPDIGR